MPHIDDETCLFNKQSNYRYEGEKFMKRFNEYRDQMLAAASVGDTSAIAAAGNAACADRRLSFLELLDLLGMESELMSRSSDHVCV